MNRHALAVLEFQRLLDEVAACASSELGAANVRALVPSTDLAWIEREHSRVAAVTSLRSGDPPWHPEPVPDLRKALERLGIPGLVWNTAELLSVRTLLRSGRRTRESLTDEKKPAAARATLSSFVARLMADKAIEATLEKSIADDATVKDEASPALRKVRRELRASEGEIVRLLEKQLARLDESIRVPDMSVTVRNGRYVIPVRREGRSSVGGIVQDSSASGATLFIEPPVAVEFGNRIRELEAEEREEVERILAELTDLVRPSRDSLLASMEALAELDSLHARATYAGLRHGTVPTFGAPVDGWTIRDGRHPLLLSRGIEVVPFDLEMTATERTLVVSGPNTGGKTVLLKAVGLLSAMGQSGIPPTCGRGSRLAIFDNYFADIGDEQSIEASLSTFSAHLKNLAEILASASAATLVLIDELGSGTDPLEGAALGWAILEALTLRGTTTLSTTHLGTLKELAAQVPGVVNASLQFDAERLAPTYLFVKGIPGRSYGISIARKLQLPEPVVARAEERVPQTERDVAALLARLEEHEAELKQRDQELAILREDATRRIQAVVKRERNVRERERGVERESRLDARKYLLNARAEIDRTLRDLKKANADELEEKARAARQQAEQLAARQAAVIEQLDVEEKKANQRPRDRKPAADAPSVGDLARVDTLGGRTGRVVEVRGADATVTVGSLKLTVPLKTLVKMEPEEVEVAVAWHGDLPEVHARTEVDVRGLRAEELDTAVMQALDDAIRADLPSLRIIHGKGTGVLRERVAEMLKKDTRVRQFRLGAWNEGGAGVTMVDLT